MSLRISHLPILFAFTIASAGNALAQSSPSTLGDAEAQKCEERILAVQRDTLNKYESALAELQVTFQKAADLEGALAVRAERARVSKEQILTDKNFVNEPKALRALQTQTTARMQELIQQLVGETVPKLIEIKKQLTIAGKLDEAVAVRTAIERLQNAHIPVAKVDAGSVVPAETLIQAYAADRGRADKIYKGQQIVVRGVVGGFRPDTDGKGYLVFLAGGTGSGWVQCHFSGGGIRFREDNQFNNTILIITGKNGETLRLQKGATAEIPGNCQGFDEFVRLARCEIPR